MCCPRAGAGGEVRWQLAAAYQCSVDPDPALRQLCHSDVMPSKIERVEPVLNVRDVAAAMKFYAQLGFVEQFRDDPDSARFVVVKRDDAVLALQWHDFVGIAGDRPNLRFPVEDVDGLSDEFGPLPDRTAVSDTAWGTREFHVRDADGNGLQFYRDL